MFAGNPTVIGFDLRNEPHTPTGDTYAQGATWGTGDAATDVRLAYEQAGNAILAADPNALIFCEGISEFPDASASGGYDTTWWGGDLQGVAQYPVVLGSPGHVVYSAHDYGPNLFQQTWFNSATTPASLDAVWNKYWGYIYTQGTAPVWVGEFGTDNTASDVSSSTAGSQGQWFSSLVSYLHANQWMGWTYWALNGEDSYDLLDNNYDAAPVSSLKQSMLASIQFPLPGGRQRVSAAFLTAARLTVVRVLGCELLVRRLHRHRRSTVKPHGDLLSSPGFRLTTGTVVPGKRKSPPAVRDNPNSRGRLSQLSRSGHKAGKAFLTSIWNSAANHWPAGTSKPGIEPVG
jgi:Cellulase (glycosyl hydrolase family 5)